MGSEGISIQHIACFYIQSRKMPIRGYVFFIFQQSPEMAISFQLLIQMEKYFS